MHSSCSLGLVPESLWRWPPWFPGPQHLLSRGQDRAHHMSCVTLQPEDPGVSSSVPGASFYLHAVGVKGTCPCLGCGGRAWSLPAPAASQRLSVRLDMPACSRMSGEASCTRRSRFCLGRVRAGLVCAVRVSPSVPSPVWCSVSCTHTQAGCEGHGSGDWEQSGPAVTVAQHTDLGFDHLGL